MCMCVWDSPAVDGLRWRVHCPHMLAGSACAFGTTRMQLCSGLVSAVSASVRYAEDPSTIAGGGWCARSFNSGASPASSSERPTSYPRSGTESCPFGRTMHAPPLRTPGVCLETGVVCRRHARQWPQRCWYGGALLGRIGLDTCSAVRSATDDGHSPGCDRVGSSTDERKSLRHDKTTAKTKRGCVCTRVRTSTRHTQNWQLREHGALYGTRNVDSVLFPTERRGGGRAHTTAWSCALSDSPNYRWRPAWGHVRARYRIVSCPDRRALTVLNQCTLIIRVIYDIVRNEYEQTGCWTVETNGVLITIVAFDEEESRKSNRPNCPTIR